jgi:hypothetical protein
MSESTANAEASLLARISHRLGVLALALLVLSGACILGLAADAVRSGSEDLNRNQVIAFSWGEILCRGGAAVAAVVAFVLGMIGLAEIRWSLVKRMLEFALLILVGACILGLAAGAGNQDLTRNQVIAFSLGGILCQGVAAVAAVVALILGILGLAEIRPGQIKGRGQAISGLVTSLLTVLILTLAYGVVVPVLASKNRKLESSNNLKELALAMQIYHDCYRRLPPAVLHDPALGARAKPYSWRVALLPILGEDNLFSQYRRDEAWDSPANKALLARMPRVFAAPGSRSAADGLTHYQVFVGPGTAFESPDLRISLASFARGADQTILIVEAASPVYWTKPEDLPYAPDGPLPKVGGLVGNGFHAVFGNGDVRWFEADQQESELRAHVPRNGH